jgi:hypothetical protein
MNKTKQFLALFKFQTTINPFIWFMPLFFGFPFFIPLLSTASLSKTYHPGFFNLLMNQQTLFFVGMFGSLVMAPERFQFGAPRLVSSYYGSEFMLTRAIDRPVLYRAKAAVLFLLVLTLPCVAIVASLGNPDLVVTEYSKPVQQQCLSNVPGSALMPSENKKSPPSLISVPRGNVLVAEWQFWIFMIVALSLQLFILILYPFKYGKLVFWALYLGLIFVPLFDLTHLGKDKPTVEEQLFFSFAAHQPLFWILTALTFVLTQLWCERRFARLEQ